MARRISSGCSFLALTISRCLAPSFSLPVCASKRNLNHRPATPMRSFECIEKRRCIPICNARRIYIGGIYGNDSGTVARLLLRLNKEPAPEIKTGDPAQVKLSLEEQ
jgi:hypothetical protein